MNIRSNIRQLTNIFLVLFVALSAGLVYWQVIVAQQVLPNLSLTYKRHCTSEVAPLRGRIFDRNAVLLAYSVKSDSSTLCGYKRVYTQAAQGLEGLLGYYISPLFATTGIEAQFNDYLNGKNGSNGLSNTLNQFLHVPPYGADIYLTIDSRIEQILVKNFNKEAPAQGLPPDSVFTTNRGSLIVSDPTTGEILGILSEPGYDENCAIECSLNQLRTAMLAKGYDKAIACAAPCSIDQFRTALDQQTVLSSHNLGSNCEQKNNCNLIYLTYLNSDPEQPLLFRPTQDCYPPGSTYKTVTLLAALDSHTMTLDYPFYNDRAHTYPQFLQAEGPVSIGSGNAFETFQPSESHIDGYTHNFPVTLSYGFSHSDNVIFAQVGVKVGTDTWLKYNQALYIGQHIPFDLPVKVSTVTPEPQQNLCSNQPQPYTSLSVTQLAEDAFGQGKDFVTPLQMMLVDNVAANDGKLMRPSVIQKIVDPRNQTVLQSFTPQLLQQVISATTAQQVRDAMYGVNACGSGSLSAVKLSYPYTAWNVIGKTGTAQVPQDPHHPNQVIPGDSWYITAAPYAYQSNQIPALTITAMKENGGEGAYANGPMLNTIYNQIFTQVKTNVRTNAVPPGETTNDATTLPFCNATGLLQASLA